MFCRIDFMAIWFFFKESVLILLASILTTTFSTDFSKVLTKVRFGPENSLALNKFLEQLLIKHENLEWVDRLSQAYKGIGSGLGVRKKILKRNDRRYRKPRKFRSYYVREHKNGNINIEEIPYLNIEDYENAMTGVIKKEGYKQQRVKQKRSLTAAPLTTHRSKTYTAFDILDLSIIEPSKNGRTKNYRSWGGNNLRKDVAKYKSKRQDITSDGYAEQTERSMMCGPKPSVKIKPEELEELMKVVESEHKKTTNKTILFKNKKLGIMNSKKNKLTITKTFGFREKNEIESTTPPVIVIVMETPQTEKALEKKSITISDSDETFNAKAPPNMISNKAKIQNHQEKNVFPSNPHMEEPIKACPLHSNIKSINIDCLNLITNPYILQFTETSTARNLFQSFNLKKRQKIVEEDPASVMSPEEIRRAKIEAKKLLDVDKDFNERNEPNFNKDVMKMKNDDYKDYEYSDKNIQTGGKVLKAEDKGEINQNDVAQKSFFSRQLLNYNYDDYENKLYSDYDDQENSLRRYPRDLNQNYKFPNEDDYFDYQNEEPLEKRFYKKRWKKEANYKNNDKGIFNKNELKNRIMKLKNFFGIGHENNYNEIIKDDYPVENLSVDEYTAKYNEFVDDNNLSGKSANLRNINQQHEYTSENFDNSFVLQSNFDNTPDQSSLARTTFEAKSESPSSDEQTSFYENQENVENENSFELNKLNSEQSTPKVIKENNENSVGQSTLPTIPPKEQSTKATFKSAVHKNFEIGSIIETTFDNYDLKTKTKSKTTNTPTTFPLTWYAFSPKLQTTTTSSNPLTYSFSYKMNLFDSSSSSTTKYPLPIKILNFGQKVSKRDLIKNLLEHFKMKQSTKLIPESDIKEDKNVKDLTENPNDNKVNIDKSLTLDTKTDIKKMAHKHKFHHHRKYHSKLKDLLKALPPQIPVAQMNVAELRLNAIKKNKEQNKKTHANIRIRGASDSEADYNLDDDDYIPSDYGAGINPDGMSLNDVKEVDHSSQMVKHDAQNSNDTKKCGIEHKTHKHRPDKENEKNAMKVVGRPKIEDHQKLMKKIDSNGNKNEQEEINNNKNKKSHIGKYSCEKNDHNNLKNLNTTCSTTKTCPTSNCKTHTCPSTCKTTTCPTTCKTTTCKTTTCPTTSKTTTCPTTCKTTTCPTTSKTSTCPTTSKTTTCPTTCKTTTCPTTCKTTTCPTTSKTTTCPTTSKTTTCPTTSKTTTCPTTSKTTTCPTSCKTTTCPTTSKTTTCSTTCKTTTCPTTCKTTTCPTTCKTTNKKCPTFCKTTKKKCRTTCQPTCPSKQKCAHSTHKFGIKCTRSPCGNANNFLGRRKIIHSYEYFDNKYNKAKFNADRFPRHVIFPKKHNLYNDMPRNEYLEMKHRNLINRLKRRYFPKENFAEAKETNLIRRKKSINFNSDVEYIDGMPIYRIYPKRITYKRYRRRKMKNNDDTEEEKQRKVLETIYHHRIQRRRNEPEYVRKPPSYDYTIENNVNLPSSYNSEVGRMFIRRTRKGNLQNADFKGTTPSDSTLSSDTLKGKLSAEVVQDLYTDINKYKNIKKIMGKALRSPHLDPKEPIPNIKKIKNEAKENSQDELQHIIDEVMNKLNCMCKVKVERDHCVRLDEKSQQFIQIITAHVNNTSNLDNEENVPAQDMTLFTESVSNPSCNTINKTKTSCKNTTDSRKIKVSNTRDPCKTKSTTTDACNTKLSATTAKTKPCKTKKTKATKTTTVKCATTKTTKCKTKKIKCQETKPTRPTVPNNQTTENISNKMWGKPRKTKIEVFNFDDNCDSNTTKPIKTETQIIGAKHKRRLGFNRSQKLNSALNAHKLIKFSDMQATMYKLPPTHRDVTNLLSMYNNLPLAEKRKNKYIYSYLHTQKLLLERLMHHFAEYNRQQRKIKLRKRQNFHQRHNHVVWVPNELNDYSKSTKYIKLTKRMITDDQRDFLQNRIKRENHFRDVMRTRRKRANVVSKLDEWMKVNIENQPLYINFTF